MEKGLDRYIRKGLDCSFGYNRIHYFDGGLSKVSQYKLDVIRTLHSRRNSRTSPCCGIYLGPSAGYRSTELNTQTTYQIQIQLQQM
jgi:hypothetical protein